MSKVVNSPRSYDSTHRQEAARQTRLAILEAARRQFLSQGYAGTTVSGLAEEAGVSVETIYKAFGNKPGLAKAVFDVAVVGDDEPVPMLERDFVRRNMAETDPRKKLMMFGTHIATTSVRTGPVQLVLRQAAASDAGAAQVWTEMQEERLRGMTAFASHLRDGGYLRSGVSASEARDVLWVHTAVELWDLLVNQRGWSHARFGRWVGSQLCAAVL